jgi:hypothetical protein
MFEGEIYWKDIKKDIKYIIYIFSWKHLILLGAAWIIWFALFIPRPISQGVTIYASIADSDAAAVGAFTLAIYWLLVGLYLGKEFGIRYERNKLKKEQER